MQTDLTGCRDWNPQLFCGTLLFNRVRSKFSGDLSDGHFAYILNNYMITEGSGRPGDSSLRRLVCNAHCQGPWACGGITTPVADCDAAEVNACVGKPGCRWFSCGPGDNCTLGAPWGLTGCRDWPADGFCRDMVFAAVQSSNLGNASSPEFHQAVQRFHVIEGDGPWTARPHRTSFCDVGCSTGSSTSCSGELTACRVRSSWGKPGPAAIDPQRLSGLSDAVVTMPGLWRGWKTLGRSPLPWASMLVSSGLVLLIACRSMRCCSDDGRAAARTPGGVVQDAEDEGGPESALVSPAPPHGLGQRSWLVASLSLSALALLSVGAGLRSGTEHVGRRLLAEPAEAPRFATVETRRREASFPLSGPEGPCLRNLGVGKVWKGYQTKIPTYLSWVEEEMRRDPEQLLVVMDGGDITFGGCSAQELLRRYHTIVKASSGPRVVAGADSCNWPPSVQNLERYNRFNGRRKHVLTAHGLHSDLPYSPWYMGSPFCQGYFHANSGFLMGPAAELAKVLRCMSKKGWGDTGFDNTNFDDQKGLIECLFLHPETITLDYAGSLVLDLYGFNHSVLTRKGERLHNAVTKKVQCFVHAAGLCSGGELDSYSLGGPLRCDPPHLAVQSDNAKYSTHTR